MLAVAVVIWWLDRVMDRSRLTAAPTRDLVILGLLAVAAYNVRREGLMLVFAIAGAQLVDLGGQPRVGADVRDADAVQRRAVEDAAHPVPDVRRRRRDRSSSCCRRRSCPTTATAGGSSPPGCGVSTTGTTGAAPAAVPGRTSSASSGCTSRPVFGRWMIGLAAVGAVVACVKAPRRNVPLAVLWLTTMLVIGTHLRMVSRYYMQITPLIVFFVAMLLLYVVGWLGRLVARRPLPLGGRRVVALLAAAPFLWLAVYPRHRSAPPGRRGAGVQRLRRRATRPGPGAEPGRHGRDRQVHPARRHRRLLPGADGDAVHRPAGPADHVVRTTWWPTATGSCRTRRTTTRRSSPHPSSSTASGFELVWENDDWRLWRIPDRIRSSWPMRVRRMFNRCSTTRPSPVHRR